MEHFLVNGTKAESLGLRDRSLHYGDGLFETIAVARGRLLCWERHLARLAHGCDVLSIPAPSRAALDDEAHRLCAGRDRGVLKIIITRGAGGRGYAPPPHTSPTRVVALYEWPEFPAGRLERGISVGFCTIRLGHQPALAGIKHLNRLEQVLARIEVAGTGMDDGLLLDDDGNVIEATSSNVFAVHGGCLLTPDLCNAGVAGVIRAVILDRAKAWDYTVHVRAVSGDELAAADEVFLSSSVAGIVPVRSIAGRTLAPGPVTGDIRSRLEREDCVPA